MIGFHTASEKEKYSKGASAIRVSRLAWYGRSTEWAVPFNFRSIYGPELWKLFLSFCAYVEYELSLNKDGSWNHFCSLACRAWRGYKRFPHPSRWKPVRKSFHVLISCGGTKVGYSACKRRNYRFGATNFSGGPVSIYFPTQR